MIHVKPEIVSIGHCLGHSFSFKPCSNLQKTILN